MSAKPLPKGASADEYLARAMRAYFARLDEGAPAGGQPNMSDSYVDFIDGLPHVVLAAPVGVRAVYRIRNDGQLKRLKRWPSSLESPNQ
jgi:hypothetical protein